MSTEAAATLIFIGWLVYTIMIAAFVIDLNTFATPQEVSFLKKYRRLSKESKRRIRKIMDKENITGLDTYDL